MGSGKEWRRKFDDWRKRESSNVQAAAIEYAPPTPPHVAKRVKPPEPSDLPEKPQESLKRVFGGVGHKNVLEAGVADLVDILPIIGDIANSLRIKDTAEQGGEYKKRRMFTQTGDLILGTAMPEPFDTIADALTPTNTFNFIMDKNKGKGGTK